MKQHFIATAFLTSAAAAAFAASTNEIVITATRIETPVNQLTVSAAVIDSETIENGAGTAFTEQLQSLPGISVSRSGGPGQATQIYLRGANPQHTQILIDGVRMNGQLDLSGYDMANLQMLDIERIEVIKGPSSPLYGSDAMAGIINIVTKKGSGAPAPYYRVEGGSYGTWLAATGINGGDARMNYSASISHFDRQGQSALKNNMEKDGTVNTTVATRIGIMPTDYADLTLTLRYIDATSDYDDGFGTAHSLYNYNTEQLITRAETTIMLANDLVESTAGIGYLMLDREELGFSGIYNADTLSADWANTIYLHDNHTLLIGVDGSFDDFFFDEGFGAIDDSLYNVGAFGSYQAFITEQWMANLGIRHDEHSEFDGETTYQASTAYAINATGTRLKASYSTGFKAPISYQLFASFGNPNLAPEESEGWEVGVEQQIISNRVDVGATYFNTDYDNMIAYDFVSWTYGNIAKASTEGVEVYGNARLTEDVSMRVAYTYLDNDDITGGSFHLKRPQHQVDGSINYAACDKLNINLHANGVGPRDDIGGATMDGYILLGLAARYQLNDRIEIYGRIENLLDEDYETVAGYNTDDLSAYAGIRMNL
ncbi:MAG: TonB-dependent receptor [Pontiellaceae bacterium]|nr:TonB-dependent receptor [Pontiellaceae bacterium]MBN2784782.1 TonB-dependent receptor [Pontiellaceae bacterium]